jgi:hypothetical protein
MPEPPVSGDIHVKAVVLSAAAILATVLLACAAAWLVRDLWPPSSPGDGPDGPLDFALAKPVLESAPQPARDAYFREKQRLLDSWQWLDRQAGIARIPVEEAMRLLAQGQHDGNQPRKEQP